MSTKADNNCVTLQVAIELASKINWSQPLVFGINLMIGGVIAIIGLRFNPETREMDLRRWFHESQIHDTTINLLAISFIILKYIHYNGKISSQEDSSSHGWIKELV